MIQQSSMVDDGDADKDIKIVLGYAASTAFNNDNGDILFKTAPTGSAGSEISDACGTTWNTNSG